MEKKIGPNGKMEPPMWGLKKFQQKAKENKNQTLLK